MSVSTCLGYATANELRGTGRGVCVCARAHTHTHTLSLSLSLSHTHAQLYSQGLDWDAGASTRMDNLSIRQASVLAGVCMRCDVRVRARGGGGMLRAVRCPLCVVCSLKHVHAWWHTKGTTDHSMQHHLFLFFTHPVHTLCTHDTHPIHTLDIKTPHAQKSDHFPKNIDK